MQQLHYCHWLSCLFACLTLISNSMPSAVCQNQSVTGDQLPPHLQQILKASSFDDDARGEGDVSKNYESYSLAARNIQNLKTADLEYLLKHASPAGRLYAAVLLKVSNRVGDAQSFGRLTQDDSHVVYKSGCEAMSCTVREIANSFMKEGRFCAFRISLFCKLKTGQTANGPQSQTDTNLSLLMSATGLTHWQQGDSNQAAPTWTAFQALLNSGSEKRSAIDQLLAAKNPVARMYGIIMLMQIDPTAGAKLASKWKTDHSPVLYRRECTIEQSSVASLCKRLLQGEKLLHVPLD